MKKLFLFFVSTSLLCSILLCVLLVGKVNAQTTESDSPCITDPVDFGIEKRFLPLPQDCSVITGFTLENENRGFYCGRGGFISGLYSPAEFCVTPTHIVMHTTKGGITAESIYNYFSGGGGGKGTGSHFVIGQEGEMLQMVDMGTTQVEYAQAMGPMDEHISIEMGSPQGDGSAGPSDIGLYQSKQDMIDRGSQLQYDNALKLAKTLMQQYKIPIENVVSHKSLGGEAGDPGDGWMADFKADLPSATGLSGTSTSPSTNTGSGSSTSTSCLVTKVGDHTSPTPPLPAECRGGGGGPSGGLGPRNSNATCPGIEGISCGTAATGDARYGCGHCSPAYQNAVPGCGGACAWCSEPPQSAFYAIDIGNPLGGDVYVPKIFKPETGQTHTLSCLGYGDIQGTSEPAQIIQTLSCKDDVTGEAVWLHFHHSDKNFPTDADSEYLSGDVVGKSGIFKDGPDEDLDPDIGPHVHFQMGIGGQCEAKSDGLGTCVEPDEYVKCGG